MKLVTQQGSRSKSTSIKELDLTATIDKIKSSYKGEEVLPRKYEIFRYKSENQLFVIYKNNRKLRSKNSWYEIRALTSLGKRTGENYYHSRVLRSDLGLETEIDGLDVETGKIMVEVKRAQINKDWINYYSKKAKKLKIRE